jgi:anti-anti-sigma factor
MRLVALRGQIVTDYEVWPDGTVLLGEGSIADVSPDDSLVAEADEVHDHPESLILPGFVDLQVNGAFGVDVASESARLPELSEALLSTGTTSYLRLSGAFDLAGVGRVENALDRVFQVPSTKRIVFDLCRLGFLDAAGLRTILRADQRARDAAVELVVVRPRGWANRVFTLTRAGAELTMVDDPAVTA